MRRCAVIAIALLMAAPIAAICAANWTSLRRSLIAFDARYLDETIWNLKHPADLPVPGALPPAAAHDWLTTGPLAVGHALGPDLAAGERLNSLDALARAQERGFSVLEVDLALTRDGDILCYHEDDRDRRVPAQLSTAQIAQLLGDGPLCRLEHLIAYARAHPDVRFIIDVKSRFRQTYERIRAIIADPAIGRQFIPQAYSFNQLAGFRRERFFAEPIFTGYRSLLSNSEIVAAAQRFGVDVVVLNEDRVDRLTHWPASIRLLVHPVNDPRMALRWLCEARADGIYTKILYPRRFPRLYDPARRGCAH